MATVTLGYNAPTGFTSGETVTPAKLNQLGAPVISAIQTADISDAQVTTAKIADDAVTTAKILNANVTTAKIADASITPSKLSQPYTLATSVASTSGTAIDFTGIPSWVRRITVMFDGVSTNGTSHPLVQVGSGSIASSGYNAGAVTLDAGVNLTTYTAGFGIRGGTAANVLDGHVHITNVSGNSWCASHSIFGGTSVSQIYVGAGSVTLSGALDRVRITTVNGTDTFDAGTINIAYEG